MSDAPPRRRRDARLLKTAVDRFADADAVQDSVGCIRPAASEAEADEWELDVFPEAAVVDGPDAEVAIFPRFDAIAVAAYVVAAAADAVA